MGVCNEKAADRTRFIINEDFRIKKEMLKAIENYTNQKKKEQKKTPNEKPTTSDSQKQRSLALPTNTMITGNNDLIISKNKLTLTEVYKLEGELGEGGYGKVFLVRHKKMKILRAMKMISVNSKNEDEKTDEEIELLRQLDHPNIVK